MNIIEKIKAPTPKKNKRNGKVATVISGVAETIALSGAFDNRPVINMVLHIVATVFGGIALNNAIKVDENENN
jgi:phage shock protein PspC (stress-responsive transcriptional regulator)